MRFRNVRTGSCLLVTLALLVLGCEVGRSSSEGASEAPLSDWVTISAGLTAVCEHFDDGGVSDAGVSLRPASCGLTGVCDVIDCDNARALCRAHRLLDYAHSFENPPRFPLRREALAQAGDYLAKALYGPAANPLGGDFGRGALLGIVSGDPTARYGCTPSGSQLDTYWSRLADTVSTLTATVQELVEMDLAEADRAMDLYQGYANSRTKEWQGFRFKIEDGGMDPGNRPALAGGSRQSALNLLLGVPELTYAHGYPEHATGLDLLEPCAIDATRPGLKKALALRKRFDFGNLWSVSLENETFIFKSAANEVLAGEACFPGGGPDAPECPHAGTMSDAGVVPCHYESATQIFEQYGVTAEDFMAAGRYLQSEAKVYFRDPIPVMVRDPSTCALVPAAQVPRTSIRTPLVSRGLMDLKKLKGRAVGLYSIAGDGLSKYSTTSTAGLFYRLKDIQSRLYGVTPSSGAGSLLQATRASVESLIGTRAVEWSMNQYYMHLTVQGVVGTQAEAERLHLLSGEESWACAVRGTYAGKPKCSNPAANRCTIAQGNPTPQCTNPNPNCCTITERARDVLVWNSTDFEAYVTYTDYAPGLPTIPEEAYLVLRNDESDAFEFIDAADLSVRRSSSPYDYKYIDPIGGALEELGLRIAERNPDNCGESKYNSLGLPRNLVPPLENELTSQPGDYDSSFQYYLSQADTAAKEALSQAEAAAKVEREVALKQVKLRAELTNLYNDANDQIVLACGEQVDVSKGCDEPTDNVPAGIATKQLEVPYGGIPDGGLTPPTAPPAAPNQSPQLEAPRWACYDEGNDEACFDWVPAFIVGGSPTYWSLATTCLEAEQAQASHWEWVNSLPSRQPPLGEPVPHPWPAAEDCEKKWSKGLEKAQPAVNEEWVEARRQQIMYYFNWATLDVPHCVLQGIIANQGITLCEQKYGGEYLDMLIQLQKDLNTLGGSLSTLSTSFESLRSLYGQNYWELKKLKAEEQLAALTFWGQVFAYIVEAIGVLAAPFTCGASLSLTAVALTVQGVKGYFEFKSGKLKQDIAKYATNAKLAEIGKTTAEQMDRIGQAMVSVANQILTVEQDRLKLKNSSLKQKVTMAAAQHHSAMASMVANEDLAHDRRTFHRTANQAQRALSRSKVLSFVARRAIEFKVVESLAEETHTEPYVESPNTWVNSLFCASERGDSEQTDVWAESTTTYVQKLRDYVTAYPFVHPFQDGDDWAVISLRDDYLRPETVCQLDDSIVAGRNLLRWSEDCDQEDAWPTVSDHMSTGGWNGTSSSCLLLGNEGNRVIASSPVGLAGFGGQSVTLSAWVRASGTGTIGVNLVIGAQCDSGPCAPHMETKQVDGTNGTWARVSTSWQLPADTLSVAVGVTSTANFYVGGLQLELGSTMTDYQPTAYFAPAAVADQNSCLALRNDHGAIIGATLTPAERSRLMRQRFGVKCVTAAGPVSQGTTDCSDQGGIEYYELPFVFTLNDIESGRIIKDGQIAVGNYNYRLQDVAVNLVGTNVKDCLREDANRESCYANMFLPYSLAQEGHVQLRAHDTQTLEFAMPTAHINSAKAIAAERFLTIPLSQTDVSAVTPYLKPEFRGRPLEGNYIMRVHSFPSLAWSNLDDIQLLIHYRYWTAFGQ
jgi:hypothetical protein